MSVSRMSSAEYLLQKTYQIICFLYSFEMLKKAKLNSGESTFVGNKTNDKNLLYQKPGEHYINVH